MSNDTNAPHIILWRPFLVTAKTKTDMDNSNVTFEFEEKVVEFKISDCMKYLADGHSLCSIDIIEPIGEQPFSMNG